jgi:hypothetical protein
VGRTVPSLTTEPLLVHASVVVTHTQLVPDACAPKPVLTTTPGHLVVSVPTIPSLAPTVDIVALRSLSGYAARGLIKCVLSQVAQKHVVIRHQRRPYLFLCLHTRSITMLGIFLCPTVLSWSYRGLG